MRRWSDCVPVLAARLKKTTQSVGTSCNELQEQRNFKMRQRGMRRFTASRGQRPRWRVGLVFSGRRGHASGNGSRTFLAGGARREVGQ